MSGGQFNCPIVFRGPNASARQVGSQHSHAMEHFYAHIPGLKVVAPAFPADAKGLLKAAIRDDNPVLVMESRDALPRQGRGPRRPRRRSPHRQGAASSARAPTCTIVAYSRMTHVALEAAADAREGGHLGRGRRPALAPPARRGHDRRVACSKTHRCVVVHEGWPYGGVGAEIADRVQRLAFDELDAPILRVTHARRARCRTTRSSSSCACRSPSASSPP